LAAGLDIDYGQNSSTERRGSKVPNKKERAASPLLINPIMSSPVIYVLFPRFQAFRGIRKKGEAVPARAAVGRSMIVKANTTTRILPSEVRAA
jgi:hypothetical protein